MLRIPETDQTPPDMETSVIALDEPTQEEAERQGWWAYCFGFNTDLNPYASTDAAFGWWMEGWYEAERESGG
jgi:ribosome modulation factor